VTAGWRVYTVDEIKDSRAGAIAIGPFGSRMKSDRYVASGVPVIRGNNLSDTPTFTGDFVFVSDATADELRSSNVFPGDLVFPHRGAIGAVGVVPAGGPARYILSTSLMKLSCNRELVDPLFLFYFFRSRDGRNALLARASTVGTPGIGQPLASLRSISILLPPLHEQQAIAEVLGVLDDKIDLNRRMSETLEAVAAALLANARSTTGPWRRAALQDISDVTMGQSPPGDTYNTEGNGWPFYQGRADFGFRFPSRRVFCTSPTRIGAAGSVLLSVRAPVGSLNVAEEEVALGRGVAAIHARSDCRSLLYHSLRLDSAGWDVFNGEGTVFGSVNKQDVLAYTLEWPDEDEAEQLEARLRPLDDLVLANRLESLTIEALRDLLLPQLTSGSVQVKAAQQLVEEVV